MSSIVIYRFAIDVAIEMARDYAPTLTEADSLFIIVDNEYDSAGNVSRSFLDVIEKCCSMGLSYVNTIVFPGISSPDRADNVSYIVWLCRDPGQMCFNKDAIREKHIWKDVEWGHRAKNYNPAGKDPGNVWIPTLDDGHGHITSHILLSETDVIHRLESMVGNGNLRHICAPGNPSRSHRAVGFCDTGIPSEPHPDVRTAKVIWGTAENMDHIASGSVKTVVTSPPYWNLKDYFKKGQIGQEDYPGYLRRMARVWSECYRILRPDGSMWININIRRVGGRPCLMPLDFIRQCTALGFLPKGILIWHKSSGIPTNNRNIVDRHEYVLAFSKSPAAGIRMDTLRKYSDYRNPDINGSFFWNINRKAGSVGKKYIHPAIFPTTLVDRVVQLSSAPGDLVVDPFLGSGTSLISAANLGRYFIGYEYNEGFRPLMESRFKSDAPGVTVDFADSSTINNPKSGS